MSDTTSLTHLASSLVEQTALPTIQIRDKKNQPIVEAYVNAYVVGEQEELLTNHKRGKPLYYLSLVAQRGQGTTLQAIFARLVNIHSQGAELEGVGTVFLAHHRQRVAACGYPIHWNFEQTTVQPQGDLHAVIESQMLTICDPVRALRDRSRRKRDLPALRALKQEKGSGKAALSTRKGGKPHLSLHEIRAQAFFPLFLLLVPAAAPLSPAMQYLAFLDPRIPWPLHPCWAPFLWERGRERGEIEPLHVWSYHPHASASPEREEEEEPEEEIRPFLQHAYLCRPNLVALAHDLSQGLREGRLALPSSPSTLPPSQRATTAPSVSQRAG